jgi:hypothetical protein
VDRFYKEMSLPHLDKTKFLVPQEITMSQFVTIIRWVVTKFSCSHLFSLRNRSGPPLKHCNEETLMGLLIESYQELNYNRPETIISGDSGLK